MAHSDRYHEHVTDQSPEWMEVREQALEDADYMCSECCATGSLEVHHLHYRTLGHEDPYEDVIVLCRECHSELHDR